MNTLNEMLNENDKVHAAYNELTNKNEQIKKAVLNSAPHFRRQEELFNMFSDKANDIFKILIIHIRDEEPGNELERIANLCTDEAIRISLLEILDIVRKQRAIFTADGE